MARLAGPVRFLTTLGSGQATVISAPGTSGEETTSISIARNGDRLSIEDRPGHGHCALVQAAESAQVWPSP